MTGDRDQALKSELALITEQDTAGLPCGFNVALCECHVDALSPSYQNAGGRGEDRPAAFQGMEMGAVGIPVCQIMRSCVLKVYDLYECRAN